MNKSIIRVKRQAYNRKSVTKILVKIRKLTPMLVHLAKVCAVHIRVIMH